MSEYSKIGPYFENVLKHLIIPKANLKVMQKIILYVMLSLYVLSFTMFFLDTKIELTRYVSLIFSIVATIMWIPFLIRPQKYVEYGYLVIGISSLFLSIDSLVFSITLALNQLNVSVWIYLVVMFSIYIVTCCITFYIVNKSFHNTPSQSLHSTSQRNQLKTALIILVCMVIIGFLHAIIHNQLVPEGYFRVSTAFFLFSLASTSSILVIYMYYIMRKYPEMKFENREGVTQK